VRDSLYNQALARVALPSVARTNGAANGTTVDTGIFGNDFRTVLFVISTGTITDGSHAVTLQDSADGSTGWTAVDSGSIQGTLPTITATDDDVILQFGHSVARQYLRLVVTTSGATTGGVFGAVAVMSDASSEPVARS
jgi:hypothetical protein